MNKMNLISTERLNQNHPSTRTHRLFKSVFGLPIVCAAEPSSSDNNNTVTSIDKLGECKPRIFVTDEDVRTYLAQETPEIRLKQMFAKSEDGSLHPDLENVVSSTQTCGMVMFMFTSIFGGRAAKEAYLQKQQHKKFDTKFRAMRAYNDAIILGGLKFGMKWGLKTAVFCGIFMLTAQSIATYRNKSSVWEYIAAGSVSGSILRLNLGLKGFFAGGVIGAVLGTIGGSMMYLLLRTSSETQEQKHYWRTQSFMLRQREQAELLSNTVSKELESSPS